MPLRKSNNRNGLTLIEAIVALAVVGIAAIGLLRMHAISIDAVGHTRHVVQASMLADARLAQTAAEALTEEREPAASSGLSECDTYRWSIAVDDASELLPEENGIGLLRLVCRVRWQAGTRERGIEMETIFWSPHNASTLQ